MAGDISFLVFCQALGAIAGVATAIWSEVAYVRALADGEVSAAERAHLRIIGRGLRFGMFLLLLSSFGLVVAAYVAATPQPALSTEYWILVAFAFVVIGSSEALSRRRISYALGSAAAFTAWWFLAYLTLGQLPALSFGAAAAFYVVATGLLYLVLASARSITLAGLKRPGRTG
jgi:hypothetical protein